MNSERLIGIQNMLKANIHSGIALIEATCIHDKLSDNATDQRIMDTLTILANVIQGLREDYENE